MSKKTLIDPLDPILARPVQGPWLAFHEITRLARDRSGHESVAVNPCFIKLDAIISVQLQVPEGHLTVKTSRGFGSIDLKQVYAALHARNPSSAEERIGNYVQDIFEALEIPAPLRIQLPKLAA